MATVWQLDPLWRQHIAIGVCPGIPDEPPAQRTAEGGSRPPANSQSSSCCKSVRSPANPFPRKRMGGDGVSIDAEQQDSLDLQMGQQSRSPDRPKPGRRARSKLGLGLVTPGTVSILCRQGRLSEAVGALESMARTDSAISQSLLYTVIHLCTVRKNLVAGRRVHCLTAELGCDSNAYVGNHILRMYARGGRLQEAMDVFTRVGRPDVFMWGSIISAHAKHGKPNEAIYLYHEMRRSGVEADAHVFAAALQACACAADLESGRKVHSDVVQSGFHINLFVANCLVDMYAKCGQLGDARQVFDDMVTKDVVTWNALISGYVKCGELKGGRQVFDSMSTKNVVTWTALIAGYVQHGLAHEALELYARMEQEVLILADHVTFACLLKACASTGALHKGRQLHSLIVERGLLDNVLVGTCLVDMYAKCGELRDASRIFDRLATKNVVTWTSLIAGYAQQGLGQEALVVYGQMEEEGVLLAEDATFACLLKACGSTGALQKGRQLHSHIVERGLLDNLVLGNCLVDMYAKCGELEDARRVFDSLATKDVVTWNALISGYGTCDDGLRALACFEEMLSGGMQPNHVTFTCLLAACSHEGLVHEGRKYFDSMADHYGIKPSTEHYNCMIDLLGRAGRLDEAEKMLWLCHGQSNVVGLRALLNACKNHGDIERAMWCFESIVRVDPQGASAYVLMANAYADAGMWTDVDRIERQRMVAGANKKPAVATIEVKKQVHRFLVGDRREDVTPKVQSTNARLEQEGGHLPHTKLVLKRLCEKEKEDVLCGHAEKLALAYGLVNTPSGTPLVVTKNLRMCSDCHSSTEILSRLEQRDIVVRDGYRLHRFANGFCSCKGRP